MATFASRPAAGTGLANTLKPDKRSPPRVSPAGRWPLVTVYGDNEKARRDGLYIREPPRRPSGWHGAETGTSDQSE